ncbi:DUF5686 and carboxypeptidase regulatory-like domain-containing protein [Chitinophaga horti]|uniref:DUF5686 and carboxypeptidase regulatory-like domain-containing protein n=1 Tax=Chitinophaga horti TaxID=2920382 RepID=A0ABY6J6H6_9BACT|nr:DUF5686 and carboxypeptidase regulatory-like domain-containing protein [Chitinophaga horti]UYQ95217.1 DUF5686 and carboxypeptidase regulatory-like domain-containing protein [Chitinophaga horti]
MPKLLLTLLCCLVMTNVHATLIRGKVTDQNGNVLPYATILIKGTTNGATANAQGVYQLEVPTGPQVIVCQYLGFKKQEQSINAAGNDQQLNFIMQPVSLQVKEVVVRSGGEDPAYAIIRQAIRKRSYYRKQVNEYTCEAYIKGFFKLRGAPKRVLGQKIKNDDLGLDSTGKGVVFLSESVTRIAFQQPDKLKLDVVSARQSGGGLGISFPAFINFYDNNVEAIISQVNPRGFISPIAESALMHYKYRLEGTFTEDGKIVNKIRVIPKRKQEPVFSGTIFITEDDWRIHSTDLLLTQEYQLELVDTLRIRQIHVPVTADVWRTKDQFIYVAIKQFGFDVVGNFVNVYSNYNLQPNFSKKYFDKTFMKYDTAAEKRSITYWDSIRPVPLEAEEARDFVLKDSTAKADRDSSRSKRHIDSLRQKRRGPKVWDILWEGVDYPLYFRQDSSIRSHDIRMKGLIRGLEYNTVEGLVVQAAPGIDFSLKNGRSLAWNNLFRYGFSNTHLNVSSELVYRGKRKKYSESRNVWTLSGGQKVSQFNPENPITPLPNSLYTLLLKENYMKLYERQFVQFRYARRFDNTLRVAASLGYENRLPLENTTDFVIFDNKDKTFLPNHPQELAGRPFVRHQAMLFNASLRFQPGQRFIEYPTGRSAMGSKQPVFEVSYSKGIRIFESDVDFDKWKVSMQDEINFKLFGELRYKLSGGGFLNRKSVSLPDLQHFNGNQTFYNINYLNSFQLAPYYQYSTDARLYGMAHVEHHFNGFLTNKIPLFNRLKWHLVGGTNAFYVNSNNNYVEIFAGLENIFKIIRVDVVAGYQTQAPTTVGVRVGFGGLLGGAVSFSN